MVGNNTVGADLSRTPPIDRPSVDGPLSELFCENTLSRGERSEGNEKIA